MRYSLFVFLVCLVFQAAADDWHFGKNFSLGPTTGDTYIAKVSWSLNPPDVPCGAVTEDENDPMWMSIWIGVAKDFHDQDADLFQPLLNWQEDQEDTGCSATSKQWCVAASTYTPAEQVAEDYDAVPFDATLDFELNIDSSKNVEQKVWINGKLSSQRSDTDGSAPTVLYSGNECYKGTCGTLNAYTWKNITVVLSAADKTFGDTLDISHGASTSGCISTCDEGKTWHIDSVTIAKDYFYSDNSTRECHS